MKGYFLKHLCPPKNGKSHVRVSEATEEELYGRPYDWQQLFNFRGLPLFPIWGPEQRPEKGQTIRTLADLDRARNVSRQLAERNPNAAGMIDRLMDYVVGRGSSTEVHAPVDDEKPPVRLGGRVKSLIDLFRKRNRWHRKEREMVRRLVRDGEFFLRFYPEDPKKADKEDRDPCTHVRWIPPSAVRPPMGESDDGEWSWGILTPAPEYDVSTPEAYCVHDFRTGKDEIVESHFIIHAKWNADEDQKRGVPSLYACSSDLEGASKLRYAMREGEKARASIAYFRTHASATEDDVRAFQTRQAPGVIQRSMLDGTVRDQPVEVVEPGSVQDIPEGLTVQPPPAANTGPGDSSVMMALEAVAARVGVPIWMVSGRNSDSNFATALTTESPHTRMIESFQALISEYSDDAQTKALEIAVEQEVMPDDVLEKCDLLVNFTSPVTRNKKEETDRRKTLNEAGIISRGTWTSEEGYDPEKEARQIEEEGPPPGKDDKGGGAPGGGMPPPGGGGGPGGGEGGKPPDSPTPSGTPAARYAQLVTSLAEYAEIPEHEAYWLLVEAEQRAVGDVWQGPSGKWFTKNKGGRTVPAKNPNAKEEPKKDDSAKKSEGKPEEKEESGQDVMARMKDRVAVADFGSGPVRTVRSTKDAPLSPKERQALAKHHREAASRLRLKGFDKEAGAHESAAAHHEAGAKAATPKAEPAKPPAKEKSAPKAKAEKPAKLTVDAAHDLIKGAGGDKDKLRGALLGLTGPQIGELRVKMGLKKGGGAKGAQVEDLLAKAERGAAGAKPKPPEPKPEEKPPPKPEPKPPEAKKEGGAVPAKDPFPPGSTRSKALAELAKGLADPGAMPLPIAEKTFARLSEDGRKMFLEGLGVPLAPGQNPAVALVDFVSAQRGQPTPPEPGFTGTDALGREWRDGELVAAKEEPRKEREKAKEEPAPAPEPKAKEEEPAAGGDRNLGDATGLVEELESLGRKVRRDDLEGLLHDLDRGSLGVTREGVAKSLQLPANASDDAIMDALSAKAREKEPPVTPNQIAQKIAALPHLKAKLESLSKLNPDKAHAARKQRVQNDLARTAQDMMSGKLSLDEASARMETLQAEAEEVQRADSSERLRRAAAIKEVLKLPPEKAAKVSAGKVGPMSSRNEQAVKGAVGWLDGIVAKGAGGEDFEPVNFYQDPKDDRATYSGTRHTVNVGTSESTSTAIHEMCHGIEEKMPGALEASLAFLEHRCGKEKPMRMNSKYPGYEDHEVGRKDNFERVLDEHLAYYVGKDYGGRATEILPMGIEALYADPAGFAAKDPEYCAFVMGILDGSLRK